MKSDNGAQRDIPLSEWKAREFGEGILGLALLAGLVWGGWALFDGSSPADPEEQPLAAFVQGLSDGVISASSQAILADQHGNAPATPLYFVEIVLKRDFLWGGQQDWNGLASAVSVLAKRAFERPDLARLRIRAANGSGEEWAYVDFMRHRLPAGWAESTYLEQFAAAEVMSGYPQAGEALCAFFAKYPSARPKTAGECGGRISGGS